MTARMVRRCRVMRKPRDMSSACRRPDCSVWGNGIVATLLHVECSTSGKDLENHALAHHAGIANLVRQRRDCFVDPAPVFPTETQASPPGHFAPRARIRVNN